MIITKLTYNNLNSTISKQTSSIFKQLSPNKKQLNLTEILDTGNTVIAVCFDNKTVAGIALMAKYKVISGLKGWIEDVVVDQEYRGQGIGQKLIEFLINEGKTSNYTEIFLFTEPEKEAAVHLYHKLGFKKRSSMVFNMKFNT